MVVGNTDVVVLTIFSTIATVAIYRVYYMVISGIGKLFSSLTSNIRSLFGDMIAKNEYEKLNSFFESVEFSIHFIVVLIFAVAASLIVPFVSVYTKGVNDLNYIYPLFGLLLCIAYTIYSLRTPYMSLIYAAGKFKDIQVSAILEAIINIAVSIAFVFLWGLVGVAIGTIVAMSYRLLFLVYYLSKNILNRSPWYFVRLIICDSVVFASIYLVSYFMNISCSTYWGFILNGFLVFAIGLGICLAINLLSNLKIFASTIKMAFAKRG